MFEFLKAKFFIAEKRKKIEEKGGRDCLGGTPFLPKPAWCQAKQCQIKPPKHTS